MDSYFAQLFLKFQERITEKVPEIRWTDLDLGQLENYEDRPAVSWPCLLIDFDATAYDQMQDNAQMGNLTFTLRLGFPSFSATASSTPLLVREKGLKYLELEHLVYLAFQGYDADGLMQSATRTNAVTEKREDGLRVRVLTFTSSFEDHSAITRYHKEDRPLLELEFLNP